MNNYLTDEDIDSLLRDITLMKFHIAQLQGKSEGDALTESFTTSMTYNKELRKLVESEIEKSGEGGMENAVEVFGEKVFGEQRWKELTAERESNTTEPAHSTLAPCVACGSPVDFTQGSPTVYLQKPGGEGSGYDFTLDIANCCDNRACVEKAWELAKECYVDAFE